MSPVRMAQAIDAVGACARRHVNHQWQLVSFILRPLTTTRSFIQTYPNNDVFHSCHRLALSALPRGRTANRGTPKPSSKQRVGVAVREGANEQASSERITTPRPGQAFGSEETQGDVYSTAVGGVVGISISAMNSLANVVCVENDKLKSELTKAQNVIAELRSKLDRSNQAADIGRFPSCIQDLVASTARYSLSNGLSHLIFGADIYVWENSGAANDGSVASRNCLKFTHPQDIEDASGLLVVVTYLSTENVCRVIAASPQGDVHLWIVDAHVLREDPLLPSKLVTIENCDKVLSLLDELQDNEIITCLSTHNEYVIASTSKGRFYKIVISADLFDVEARSLVEADFEAAALNESEDDSNEDSSDDDSGSDVGLSDYGEPFICTNENIFSSLQSYHSNHFKHKIKQNSYVNKTSAETKPA